MFDILAAQINPPHRQEAYLLSCCTVSSKMFADIFVFFSSFLPKCSIKRFMCKLKRLDYKISRFNSLHIESPTSRINK